MSPMKHTLLIVWLTNNILTTFGNVPKYFPNTLNTQIEIKDSSDIH